MFYIFAVLPDGLETRFRELRRRPTLRRKLKERTEQAVVRVASAPSHATWVPTVPLHPQTNDELARWIETVGDAQYAVGLDDEDRPILVRLMDDEPAADHGLRAVYPQEDDDASLLHVRLLDWQGNRVEIVGLLTSDSISHVTWVDFDAAGRPERFATCGTEENALGKGGEVAHCTWDAARCVEVRRQIVSYTGRTRRLVRRGEYEGDRLVRVLETESGGEPETVWERDLHGWDSEALAPADAMRAFAAALGRAVRRAVPVTDVADPFALRVYAGWESPPSLVLGSSAHREAARGRVESPFQVVTTVSESSVALWPYLDDDGRRAMRSLRQQVPWSLRPYNRAWLNALEALVRELDDIALPGRVEPFLPLVGGGLMQFEDGEPEPLAHARRALGDTRVDAFVASLEPPPDARRPPPIKKPPRSRQELADIVAAYGLSRSLAGQAAWGAALVARGKGASRLGGRPDLPLDQAWPVCEGRPLTHLASIHLHEVPDFEGRDRIPADGILVFCADLSDDATLWDPVVAGEDPRVFLRHLPPGTPLHQPDPPPHEHNEYDPPVLLRERRIAFKPVLTLPEHVEGLTAVEQLDYDAIFGQLLEITPGLSDPAHLLLGHPGVVQEDPRDRGQLALLHVGWDEALGFEFLDGGDLTIFGDEADVSAGRWDELIVSSSSC